MPTGPVRDPEQPIGQSMLHVATERAVRGTGARPPRLTPFCHADLLLAMLPAAPQPLASTMHWSARAVLTTVGRGEGGRGRGGGGREKERREKERKVPPPPPPPPPTTPEMQQPQRSSSSQPRGARWQSNSSGAAARQRMRKYVGGASRRFRSSRGSRRQGAPRPRRCVSRGAGGPVLIN